MADRKPSATRHMIGTCITALAGLLVYPTWHVLNSEQVVEESEHDGRVAQVVAGYSPTSLGSYLGAYFPQFRKCGAWLKVRDRNGEMIKSVAISESTSCNLPADIKVFALTWQGGKGREWLMVGLNTSTGGTRYQIYDFPP
jgi:hypothetical protein